MIPARLSISAAADGLQRGQLDRDELAAACRERIRSLNPQLNAFISLSDSDSKTATTASDRAALSGIPLAIKDLIDIAGQRTTGGSRFFGEKAAREDARVITLLRQAGATFIGKTNLHEIALGVTNNNPHFGPCRNPWDQQRISGGSSGGSAVAVATGMALGALGTDTGGSIRIPAALCGVVGLKPTYGRVSLRGVMPLSWNLDHVGPITSTVRDAALLLQEIAGYDSQDPASVKREADDFLVTLEAPPKNLMGALAVGEYLEAADQEVLGAVREAAAVLRGLGATIAEVEPAGLHAAARANLVMTQADAATFHAERLRGRPDWFGEDVRRRLEAGTACTATEYAAARRAQAEARRGLDLFFGEYDFMLLPTTPVAAPLIEGPDAVEQARLLTRFTAPFNITGLPALSVPCGFTESGLPIGLQIVAAPWQESLVLRVGNAYAQASDWHTRTPPLAI